LTKADPDIVCFNETKTDAFKIDKEKFWAEIPTDYEQHWNCSKNIKGYSGTAILTKIKPLKVTHDLGISKHDSEGRVITMEF
jgi:exodeoxyribonuclease III